MDKEASIISLDSNYESEWNVSERKVNLILY